MITSVLEYAITTERAQQFAAALERLRQAGADAPWRATRIAAARSQLAALERELAMWDAGIREPVPGSPVGPVSDITEDDYQALSPADRATWNQRLVVAVKQAEIANFDRQIGIALDRIADWRRHRAWLEREIGELAATDRQPVASRT